LVHVGLAIAKIDRAQAERAWQVLQEIGQTSEVDVAEIGPGDGGPPGSEPVVVGEPGP
jgi:hypothetical protein